MPAPRMAAFLLIMFFAPLLATAQNKPKIHADKLLKEEAQEISFFIGAILENKIEVSTSAALLLADHLNYCLLESENIAGKEKILRIRVEDALKKLKLLRFALQKYYAKNLKYPLSLTELCPKFLTQLPKLRLCGPGSGKITEINDKKASVSSVISDSGGLIYFANPGSPNYGLVIIDSTIEDSKGEPLYLK